jgi:uncharacterized protein with HEPN domain
VVKSPLARLDDMIEDDMIEAIDGIQQTVEGVTFRQYRSTWHIRRATERGIEIISEASRHIPKEWKARFPDVQWRQVAGIGNILRHEYHRIEDRVIWTRLESACPR